MDFTAEQSRLVEAFLDALKGDGITYVVPRGYEDLPRSVPGGDVDVYVRADHFRPAIDRSKQLGLQPGGESGINEVISAIVADPKRAGAKLLREPVKAFSVVYGTLAGEDDLSSGQATYRDYRAYGADVMIHLMNHEAYESPMNGGMIRVHPDVEDSMFRNRRKFRGIFVPAEPDELCHLICRGVFSYSGDFPTYYVERCVNLYSKIRSSATQERAFERLLSKVFFEASEVVLEAIADKRYADIKAKLINSSGY